MATRLNSAGAGAHLRRLAGAPPSEAARHGNRLAARQPLPVYTVERHAAHLAREALQ